MTARVISELYYKYKYGKIEYQSKKKMMYLRGTKVGSNKGRQTWFEEAWCKNAQNTLPKNPCSSAKIEKGISIVKDLSQLYGTVILKTTFPKRTEWRW